ncbi:MAG TPA: hypothetical protein VK850_13205, partial [Candidatus Binatia bacterium]|nr:hypothetical protein [Candidatus Binatia bacterium]
SAPVRISVVGTNEPPPTNVAVVTVYAIDSYASEGGLISATNPVGTYETNVIRRYTNVALFEIRRSGGSADTPLRVLYEMHGTATEGVDYLDLPEIAEIPAGQRSARVIVVPIDDALPEKLESVVICLRPSLLAGPLPGYVIGRPSEAAAVIADNDTPDIRCISLSDGVFHLCQPAPDGQCFRVECSTDLQQWTVLSTVTALEGAVRYADAEGIAYEHRFYRAIPVPCPPLVP